MSRAAASIGIESQSSAAGAARAVPGPPGPPGPFAGKRIHLIGIGGCGMSGLARLLRDQGAVCGGSDSTSSDVTESLIADGIAVNHDQAAGSIPDECDFVVASAAIRPDHPEMLAAEARGVPIHTYAEMLGQVQAGRMGVSIAGTHGKSTTTAMLCHVLIQCGLDPSFIVGATCEQIAPGHGGSRTGPSTIPIGPLKGRPGILVAEACEFNRSFHHHRPVIALINNVEEDHLDIYGSLDNVVKAFAEFAQLIPGEGRHEGMKAERQPGGDESSTASMPPCLHAASAGRLLIAHEGAHRREVTAGLACRIDTFGYNPAADYQVITDQSVRRVGVLQDGHWLAQWTNAMPGEHNALNSAAAAILANWLGADWDDIAAALTSFRGIDRRMQRLGTKSTEGGEVVVYDDYGHHPTEIEKTLKAIRMAELSGMSALGPRPSARDSGADSRQPTADGRPRLICVFQPHQHSRTRFLLEEFAQSFSSADVVIVPHIYFVRDSEIEKTRVSAADLVDKLQQRGVTAMHMDPFEAIVEQLEIMCRPGDVVVIMGAGPVWKVGRAFLER